MLCDDLTRVDFNPYVLGRDANVYEKGRDRGQELRLGGDRFDTNNVHIPLVSVKRDLVSVKRDLTSQGKQTHLVVLAFAAPLRRLKAPALRLRWRRRRRRRRRRRTKVQQERAPRWLAIV